jgi:hypothetical protein
MRANVQTDPTMYFLSIIALFACMVILVSVKLLTRAFFFFFSSADFFTVYPRISAELERLLSF